MCTPFDVVYVFSWAQAKLPRSTEDSYVDQAEPGYHDPYDAIAYAAKE